MLDLAENNTGEPIRLKDVARRQEVSEKYLEQIIAILNKAGYVRSIRGPMGGYILAKPPAEYTVGMILRLTEGSLAPVECIEDDKICSRQENCVTRYVWAKIADAVQSVVDHITLEDLKTLDSDSANYVI